ncbi:MAG: hypothetical protein AB2A00_24245 [Myxococcota bacterium]
METALVALALRGRPPAEGTRAPVADALKRKSYVAPVDGNDSTATGSTTKPFKTLAAAVDRMGKPLSQADFEAPWVIEALQPGRLDDDAPFIRIPTRRVTLRMPGVFLPSAVEFTVRDADKHGSSFMAELALLGGPPGRFGGLGVPPTDAFRIRNPAGNALLVDGERQGVLVRMDGVVLAGHFLHAFSGAAGTVGVTLEASRTIFSGVTLGPGIGAVLGGPTASKCYAWLRECVVGAKYGLELRALLEAAGCYFGGPVTAQDAPADVVIGVTDCMWLHGSSWTGPAGSMLVDRVTDYWLTKNGIAVSPGAKRVMG